LRAVVQRVSRARVVVDGETVADIGAGVCVLLGVAEDDGEGEATRLAGKVAHLRIFENEQGRFARSLIDTTGEAARRLRCGAVTRFLRASPLRRTG
jgi:D-aminoacyl-tRNA deacylase